jgi:DNA-binding transcriptional LysR family regulator
LNLRVFNSKGVEEAVANERYELSITLSHCPSENLKAEKPGADELVAVVSKRHRLAGKTTVKAEDLANEILLMRGPTSVTRLFLESRSSKADIQMVYGMELNDNQVIKAFVEYNLGIAILSGRTVAAEVSSGRMSSLKIQGLELHRDFNLVSRKNHSLIIAHPRVRFDRS